MTTGPSDNYLRKLLTEARNVAVVGISPRVNRPSYAVASYLRDVGYRIFPVNPAMESWNGLPVYDAVSEIPEQIDIVDIFRRPLQVGSVVGDAIAAGAGAVWMQQGIVNEDAAQAARDAGLDVVMDRCMLVEHHRLIVN